MPLPEPQGGLVISYAYLWRHESQAGRVEGTKNRPCVLVLVVKRQAGAMQGEASPVGRDTATIVTVAPITHTPPHDPSAAMEIPLKVKRHLGLDSERSWVILDEFNEFAWPGFDLRPVPGMPGCFEYGLLPPALYRKIVERILELRRERRVFVSLRDA
jgi:hypothetical protein